MSRRTLEEYASSLETDKKCIFVEDKRNITQENPYRIYNFCAKWWNNRIETNDRTNEERARSLDRFLAPNLFS